VTLPRRLRQICKLFRLLPSAVFRRGLRHGVAATVEHAAFFASIAPDMVVDIGANKGQFALFVRDRFPHARIVSFEPMRKAASRYARLFLGDTRTMLHPAAIGPDEGVANMYISARDDSSSLLPIDALQTELFPGTQEIGREEVRVAPLSAFLTAEDIPADALLKLDVQGFELRALEGCDGLLSRFAWIYVESSFVRLYEGQALADDVIAFLQARGFALSGIYNLAQDDKGRPIQADFTFTRRS